VPADWKAQEFVAPELSPDELPREEPEMLDKPCLPFDMGKAADAPTGRKPVMTIIDDGLDLQPAFMKDVQGLATRRETVEGDE
jgi:hypothetical protein